MGDSRLARHSLDRLSRRVGDKELGIAQGIDEKSRLPSSLFGGDGDLGTAIGKQNERGSIIGPLAANEETSRAVGKA